MASGPPITDRDRDQVKALHAEGCNRNEIARRIGRSPSTVTKLARALGLSFDRTKTKAATAARVADAKARRAELAALLIEDAHRLRAQMWEPCTLVKIGGKDNIATREPLDQPLFEDQLKIMQTTSLAAERHARLVEMDADTGAAGARSVLGQLGEALQLAAEQIDGTPPDEPES